MGMVALPVVILKIVTLVLIIFFPVSIFMAWLFERSPLGFIRTGSEASLTNPDGPDQKKPFTSNVVILLLLATGISLFSLFPSEIKNLNCNALVSLCQKKALAEI